MAGISSDSLFISSMVTDLEKQQSLLFDKKEIENNIVKTYWKHKNSTIRDHLDSSSDKLENGADAFSKSLNEPPSWPNLISYKPVIPKWPLDATIAENIPDFIEESTKNLEQPFNNNMDQFISKKQFQKPHSKKMQSQMIPEEIYNWENKPKTSANISHTDLVFSSHFECGNLSQVFKIGPFAYDLRIKEDTHTAGHVQWYFFKVSNMIADVEYEFQISNLMKSKSLYEQGQRPLLYSDHLAQVSLIGWKRFGYEITYTQNHEQTPRKSTYTLKFKFKFPQSKDVVYISNCYPYSYSQLQRDLLNFKTNPLIADRFRHKILGKTPLGNNLDMICVSAKAYSPDELKTRKAIILIARVHPGESFSSFFIKSFIEFCLGSSTQAQHLRKNFVIKIIPMLNPDGVILGNHRCNYNGFDLNRAWKGQTHALCPEILFAKNMISETAKVREIAFFCDIHSHSRKFDAFMYGCSNISNSSDYLKERIFPFLLHRQHPDIFSFKNSTFGITAQKHGTARVVVRREFNVVHAFTLEISFAGNFVSERAQCFNHYDLTDIYKMGSVFASSTCSFVFESYSSGCIIKEIMADNNFDVETEDYTDDSSSDDELLRFKIERKKKNSARFKNIKVLAKKEPGAASTKQYPSPFASRPSSPSIWSSCSSISISSSKSYKTNDSIAFSSSTASKYPLFVHGQYLIYNGKKINTKTIKQLSKNEDSAPMLRIQNMSASIMQLENDMPPSNRRIFPGAVPRPQSANIHKGITLFSRSQSSRGPSRFNSLNNNKSITVVPTVTLTNANIMVLENMKDN